MTAYNLVRDYENPTLPLTKRLPSLARRFSCLEGADGIYPWSAKDLHAWVLEQGEGSAAWHAGHLILNVFGEGPWELFDAVAAVKVWNDDDRAVFAGWARTWQ